MLLQAQPQIPRLREPRRIARGDCHVDRRQAVLSQAKGLAREALDAVARNSGAESARRYRQSQSRRAGLIFEDRQTEVRVGKSSAALPDSAKFGRLVQTLARLELEITNR